jgi:hypothetical protein
MHGGTVTVVPVQEQVTLGGEPVLTAADTFIVGGCPFMIGPAPSPCLTVQWVVTDTASTAAGNPTLSSDSAGLCIGAAGVQGSVIISGPGQAQVTSL